MTSRPITVPRSSSSRPAATSPSRTQIESLIPLPMVASSSNMRSTARSYPVSSSSISIRNSPRSRNGLVSQQHRDRLASTLAFEPRVIRADSVTAAACVPDQSSSSSTSLPSTASIAGSVPLRPHRPSATNSVAAAGSRTQRSSTSTFSHLPVSASHIQTPLSSSQAPFPPPSYLDYSALRYRLTTNDAQPTHVDDEKAWRPGPLLPSNPWNTDLVHLPTRWSEQIKSNALSVSPDGRELIYSGSGTSSEREAAAARANHPIPPACGIYYYEVEIVKARASNSGSKARISIGFSVWDVSLSRLPGWEENSWGYHGDDGCSYASQENGSKYGPTFGTGDIIGCGIDFTTKRAFYTKNGTTLGFAFPPLPLDHKWDASSMQPLLLQFYPSVGMKHMNDTIKVNFGQEPFRYEIDWYVQQAKEAVWNSVLATPIHITANVGPSGTPIVRIKKGDEKQQADCLSPSSEADPKTLLNKLVMEYLDHYGYGRSAKALGRSLHSTSADIQPPDHSENRPESAMDVDITEDPAIDDGDEPKSDAGRRSAIVQAVREGDIDYALESLRKWYPRVVDPSNSNLGTIGDGLSTNILLLKLQCRKFIELILDGVRSKRRVDAINGGGADDTMDVDDMPGPKHHTNGTSGTNGISSMNLHTQSDAILQRAIAYGQSIQTQYSMQNEEVKEICRRTFGIVAWEDPAEAGGVVAETVGMKARHQLAEEIRCGILISQNRPTFPFLEMIYRHTSVAITEMGGMGYGAAAFVDMGRELRDI